LKNIKKNAQSIIEYALILALVAIMAVMVLNKFGQSATKVGNRTNAATSNGSDSAMADYCSRIKKQYSQSTGLCTQ